MLHETKEFPMKLIAVNLQRALQKIAEMLSRPTSEVSQEELLNFIMEVNAKFGEDAVKAELQRVTRGGATKGGTE